VKSSGGMLEIEGVYIGAHVLVFEQKESCEKVREDTSVLKMCAELFS